MVDNVPIVEYVHIFQEEAEGEDRETGARADQPVFDPEVLLAEVGVETGGEEDLGGKYHPVHGDGYHVEDVRSGRAARGGGVSLICLLT